MCAAITPRDIGRSFLQGSTVALIASPWVNAFNRISIVSCIKGVGTLESCRKIFSGTVEGTAKRGLSNFLVGWSPYMLREMPRCFIKPVGAQILVPRLERHFDIRQHPEYGSRVSMIFAGSLALADMSISSLDGIRVRCQANLRAIPTKAEAAGKNRFLMLSQGAVANGLRQFAIWWTWKQSELPCKRFVRESLMLNPEGLSGFLAQAALQAPLITLASYGPERLKNELQYNPDLVGRHKYRYVAAFQHIIKTQGYRGLSRGFVSKIGSVAGLTMAFNYLVNEGRKRA